VTRELVRHLGPEDCLHLVELNDRFVRLLERRLATEPAFQRVADRVKIYHRPVQEVEIDEPYDHIVCGIPFNNLSPDLVRSIFDHMVDSLRDGGTLSFFEYLWVRQFRMLTPSRKKRKRVAVVGSVLQSYLDRYELRHDNVYLNVLPAVAHHLRVGANGSPEVSHAAVAE
jgi:phosphatidylethanolamine/phosphatidyl-N-methylethanolamine N-methyltransferase